MFNGGLRLRDLLLGDRGTTERPRLVRSAAVDWRPDDGDWDWRGEARVAGVRPRSNLPGLRFFTGEGEFSEVPRVSLMPSASVLFFIRSVPSSSSLSASNRFVSDSWPVTLTEILKTNSKFKAKLTWWSFSYVAAPTNKRFSTLEEFLWRERNSGTTPPKPSSATVCLAWFLCVEVKRRPSDGGGGASDGCASCLSRTIRLLGWGEGLRVGEDISESQFSAKSSQCE